MSKRPSGNGLDVGGASLAARTREMVDLRRQGMTLREIGDRYGLTRQRVAQIIDAAGRLQVADVAAAHVARPVGILRTRETRESRQAQKTAQSIAERRANVRELLERGLSPSQIAIQLNTWLYTVYSDLAWLRAVAGQHRLPR